MIAFREGFTVGAIGHAFKYLFSPKIKINSISGLLLIQIDK
jgi:hypothetical protein